jgi:NTE family protein
VPDPDVQEILSPVEAIPKPERLDEHGVALCLSGGGYRAMVFHLGALWRLNELGFLPKLTRASSVSGGSITAAVLGWRWRHLQFDVHGVASNLRSEVIERVQGLADHTIDLGSILGGLLLPGSISDKLTNAYAKHLFGDATLQDLPADGQGPRFVINASSVQTGALWRFSRPYMADYRVGLIPNPTVPLAWPRPHRARSRQSSRRSAWKSTLRASTRPTTATSTNRPSPPRRS